MEKMAGEQHNLQKKFQYVWKLGWNLGSSAQAEIINLSFLDHVTIPDKNRSLFFP